MKVIGIFCLKNTNIVQNILQMFDAAIFYLNIVFIKILGKIYLLKKFIKNI